MDAAGQLAELVECTPQLVFGLAEELSSAVRFRPERRAGKLKR
jgi:hypothetical protein